MKKLYLTLFSCVAAIAANHAIGQTFSYTGALQTYVVPSGVTLLTIDASGASGGSSYSTYGAAGSGGRVQCDMTVTPGQVLYMYVGGKGANGTGSPGSLAGGWNGGGNNGSFFYSGSGGGATDIRSGGTALSNRVVVAGAGGGGGYNCSSGNGGGNGGGLVGDTGSVCSSKFYSGFCYNPRGGTQTAGGQSGTCGGGSGALGTGAAGSSYGGGGGGGYYGGGGGYYAGGAGGSSYTDPATVSSVVHTQGYNVSANGSISFTTSCPLPTVGPILGITSVTAGSTETLSDATTGGVWSSSNTSVATIGTSGVYTGITAGTATISYSVTNVCGTASSTIVITVNPVITLSLAPVPVNGGVSVYPNPASNTVNIQWHEQPTGKSVFSVTDVTGREVLHSVIGMNTASGLKQIDLGRLVNGTYIISIKADNINYNGKLLIQQ